MPPPVKDEPPQRAEPGSSDYKRGPTPGVRGSKKQRFLPIEESVAFARGLQLKKKMEWEAWCRLGKRPSNIPSNPHTAYKHTGWQGWGHWLGTSNILPQQQSFLSFGLERAQYQVDTLIATRTRYLLPRVGANSSLLVEAAQQCAVQNFDLASTSDVFLCSSMATVADLLGKEAVHAGSEDAVLGAMLRWVGHDEQARGQHLEALLGHANLDAVSCSSLSQALGDQVVRSNPAVFMTLTDALRSAASATEHSVKRARTL